MKNQILECNRNATLKFTVILAFSAIFRLNREILGNFFPDLNGSSHGALFR